jgi:hypothetical protein
MAEKELGRFKAFWARFLYRNPEIKFCFIIFCILVSLMFAYTLPGCLWYTPPFLVNLIGLLLSFYVCLLLCMSYTWHYNLPEYKLAKAIKGAQELINTKKVTTLSVSAKLLALIFNAQKTGNPEKLFTWTDEYRELNRKQRLLANLRKQVPMLEKQIKKHEKSLDFC